MARRISAMIVEDSTTARKIIISALKQTGLAEFDFTEAVDGVDALQKFELGRIQVVFIDMNMPRMGGIELIRELRKKHPLCPPAVLITAESDADRLKEALSEPGVVAFLLKPVDRDRLRSGLKTLIDNLPESAGPCPVPYGENVPLAFKDVVTRACNVEIHAAEEDADIRNGNVILGLISVFGGIHWSVELGFQRETARKIAARFAGSEQPLDGADLGDAIGELTNIVGGRIKRSLSASEIVVQCSFPTVIAASHLQLLTPRRLENAVSYTHFECLDGKMWSKVTVGLAADILL